MKIINKKKGGSGHSGSVVCIDYSKSVNLRMFWSFLQLNVKIKIIIINNCLNFNNLRFGSTNII